MTNETAQKLREDEGFNMERLLSAAAEQEVKGLGASANALPQLAAAKAGGLSAARLVIPSIEGHFERSRAVRDQERAETENKIKELEAAIHEDMAVFVDLSHRIAVRSQQVQELRIHAIKVSMERTLFEPPAMPQYRPASKP